MAIAAPRAPTADERAAFLADGVVHLRAVLDDPWIDRLRTAVATVVRADAADLTGMADALAGGPQEPRGGEPGAGARGRFVAGVDHWRRHPVLAELALASPLPAVAAALLGSESLVLYEDSVLVKEPGTAEATVWHQDLGYFHVDGTQLCTTWCPLDPVTEETGAVRYVRGSHRWGRLFRPNLFVTDEPIPGTEGEAVPDVDAIVDPADIVTFATEPGDVVVHHAATLHAAGPNRSRATARRAVSVRYCGDDAVVRLRPGAPRKPQQSGWRDGDRVVDLAGPDFPTAHLP
jgi:ectoine hydroxylase-related dioxygenase (phytanoyl-CoA dioxygenase family)